MIVAWKFKKEIIQQSSHFIEIVTAQKNKKQIRSAPEEMQ